MDNRQLTRDQTSDRTGLSQLLEEIWDTFHPSILWWSNRQAATRPENVDMVYKALLAGPPDAMAYAAKLKKRMAS